MLTSHPETPVVTQTTMSASLLLGHTHSLSLVTGGLGMLTSHPETPVMTQTTMSANLLQPLQILTKLIVEDIGHDLVGFTILNITLSIQEPVWDLVLTGILHDSDDLVSVLLGQFTSSLVKRDVSLLKDEVGVPTSDTLNGGQSEHDICLSLNVGVQHTKNVLKVRWVHQRHGVCLLSLVEVNQAIKAWSF